MSETDLTPRQLMFADEYVASGNAYQSAIKAGYSENYAKGNVIKLLENVSVKSYLKSVADKLQSEKIADMREVKEYWTKTMRNEEEETRERTKASELIARTNAAFVDKIEHSGNVDINNPMKELTTEELRKLIDK